MEIRRASAKGVAGLACLMGHLGYPTSVESMKTRFKNIDVHPDYHTLIAADNSNVAGMIGLVRSYFYERNGSYVRITALIVDPHHQKRGIGRKLLEAAEQWSKDCGAEVIALNSGKRRERDYAHTFYTNAGFEAKSIGFVKKI